MATVTERVKALVVNHPIKLSAVHLYCDVDGSWQTFSNEGLVIDQDWTPTQIDEWMSIKVQGLTEDDMSTDDNGTITGWGHGIKFLCKNDKVWIIQGGSDRDHLTLIVLQRE